jgi:heme-degrading monooxygenase HmoA
LTWPEFLKTDQQPAPPYWAAIFISYWASLEAIERWKEDSLHKTAKDKGKKSWYTRFISQVVEIKSHTIKS